MRNFQLRVVVQMIPYATAICVLLLLFAAPAGASSPQAVDVKALLEEALALSIKIPDRTTKAFALLEIAKLQEVEAPASARELAQLVAKELPALREDLTFDERFKAVFHPSNLLASLALFPV